MFTKLFRRKSAPQNAIVIAHLAARVQPFERGTFFEDPLDEELTALGIGKVVGGGTELADDPVGISACDIEISVQDTSAKTITAIITILNKLGAPKGSEIRIPGQNPVPFGVLEGMAIFLNGTDLPQQVYESSDVNSTVQGLSDALGNKGEFRGHWQGHRETGLYFYGASFMEMKKTAMQYADGDLLCNQCRIEQIA